MRQSHRRDSVGVSQQREAPLVGGDVHHMDGVVEAAQDEVRRIVGEVDAGDGVSELDRIDRVA